MIAILACLIVAILASIAWANALERDAKLRRLRVIGRDVPALPRTIAQPTSWRRGAWRIKDGGRP